MDIKFPKGKKNFQKGGLHGDPDIFWAILLSIGLVMLILSLTFGLFLFGKINNDLSLSPEENTKKVIIDQARINKALEYFAERKKVSDEILYSPPSIVDPSV